MAASRRSLLRSNRSGFTLLEVIIAMTIMVLAFASILAVESNSINATIRTREMNIVAMLAREKMVEFEYDVEGKTFEEIVKKKIGTFDAPYETFRWEREVREIKFPNMAAGASAGKKDDGGGDQYAELLGKLVTQYFSKAIRELVVTIWWKRTGGESSFTVSTYWVDLNHEFDTTEQ